MFLLNLIFFSILIFLVFYFPGRLILRVTGYNFDNFLTTFSSSIILGIAFFLFSIYILSFLNLAVLYNLIIPVVLFFEYKHSFLEFKQKIKIKKELWAETFLILLGSLTMVYLTWNSGSYHNGNLLFYGVNAQDSIFHLALIRSLTSNFPPFHPGLSGVYFQGYHFFYDFLISNFSKFYQINVFDLFFRFFPVLISLMYGFTSFALAKFLKWKKITTILFIFLMYFVQSFDFFAFYIYRFFNLYYNSSGITQSLANIIEPAVIMAISFIFVGFIFLFSKKTNGSLWVLALVIGVIPQISIYSAVLFYVGLFVIAINDYLKEKNFYYFKVLILSGVISAIAYMPLNFGAGGLIFSPLLIYKNFIDSAWIFKNLHWNVNYIIYIQNNNYLHIAYFYFIAISIFLITGLGVRISIILYSKKLFNKNFYTPQNIFWSSSIMASFIIPSFFIQTVSVFSVIHFFWVGYILILIPTAFVLGSKLEKSGKPFIFLSFLILSILFLPDLINIVKKYSIEPFVFESELIKQSKIMSQVPQNEGIIVLSRAKFNDKYVDIYNIPIFSAISGHSIYLENELAEFKGTDDIIGQRKASVDKIVENVINCKDPIIAQNNIINVMKSTNNKYLLILNKNKCTQKFNKLKIINEENKSVFYRI